MKMNLARIKEHWEEAGRRFPAEGRITPTSRDPYLGQLEEDNILSFLDKGYIVLEMGCGDASHTVKYARKVKRLSGIDIAESLIKIAKMRVAKAAIENVDLMVGSILHLKEVLRGRQFDCITSQRCLINLPQWDYQQVAILQAHSLLREGGVFLMTEGFQGELDNLNIARQRFGLPAIAVNYNRNLIREDFEEFIRPYFDVIETRHYGAYLFLSRLFHPLAVLPDEPKHDSRLNEIAMEIFRQVPMPDVEKFSYNRFYVLRKK
jgi:ubiquinone/menaquinone biosynthesis C-methylase UbiE